MPHQQHSDFDSSPRGGHGQAADRGAQAAPDEWRVFSGEMKNSHIVISLPRKSAGESAVALVIEPG
jgi:hypothetical protein